MRTQATPPDQYLVTDVQKADIRERFTYHAAKELQPERYAFLRSTAEVLALDILKQVPQGREQALALTKLEEAIMWANAGIARGE